MLLYEKKLPTLYLSDLCWGAYDSVSGIHLEVLDTKFLAHYYTPAQAEPQSPGWGIALSAISQSPWSSYKVRMTASLPNCRQTRFYNRASIYFQKLALQIYTQLIMIDKAICSIYMVNKNQSVLSILPQYFYALLKYQEIRVWLRFPTQRPNFPVYQRRKHLGFNKSWEKWKILIGLIWEEGCLVKIMHKRFPRTLLKTRSNLINVRHNIVVFVAQAYGVHLLKNGFYSTFPKTN